MIGTLHIKNVGIIDDLEVNLNEGFNVFTGETGAGKTLIIDSLQILAGGRFSKEIIRHGEKSSYIEMIVYLENEEYLISREVHISGRNICKINGRLTTVNELKTFMKKVIDIHGQQDNQTILESASHIKFVDDYIGKELEEIKNKYLEKYNRYITIKEELKKNYGDDKEKQRKLDLLNYQYNEIEEANLKENEETNLDEKLKKILNSEKIKNNLEEAHYSLEEGILSELSNVLRAIEKISDYDNEYNKCREIIQNAYYDLEEVEKDLYNYKENAYFDEEERINIEQRIDLIQDLKRKYGNNIEEILEYQKDVKEQIETIENLSDYIEQIKNEKTEIEKELQELSTKMHDLRQIYSNKMSEQINTELQDLEMRNARFYVQIENREEYINKAIHIFQRFIQIHPYVDGNGRTSRALLDIMLINRNIVPPVLYDTYYQRGKLDGLSIEYLSNSNKKPLEDYINMQIDKEQPDDNDQNERIQENFLEGEHKSRG